MKRYISVILTVAMTFLIDGTALAVTTVSYSGQGFEFDGTAYALNDARCGSTGQNADDGRTGQFANWDGSGQPYATGQGYLVWVLTANGATSAELNLPDRRVNMIKVGGTFKYASPSYSYASLVNIPVTAVYEGQVKGNVRLVVSHGCQPSQTPDPGHEPQSACDHPYFPLRLGATWTYASSAGMFTWDVIEVSGDLNAATAVLHATHDSFSIDYNFSCTDAGIVSYDFLNSAAGGATFEVIASSGVWLPPAQHLVPGFTWQNAYTLRSSIDLGGETLISQSDVSQLFEMAGTDNITIEAGAFDALRLSGQSAFTTTITGLPLVSFEAQFTHWFADGVGFVRNVTSSGGVSDTISLVSYSIP